MCKVGDLILIEKYEDLDKSGNGWVFARHGTFNLNSYGARIISPPKEFALEIRRANVNKHNIKLPTLMGKNKITNYCDQYAIVNVYSALGGIKLPFVGLVVEIIEEKHPDLDILKIGHTNQEKPYYYIRRMELYNMGEKYHDKN